MILQQSTSLREFPREFIALFHIARFTTNNQIGNIIGWYIRASHAAQWESVLDMMLPPFNFSLAVIAFTFLIMILLLDLGGSVFTSNSLLSRFAIANMNFIAFRIMLVAPSIIFNVTRTRKFAGQGYANFASTFKAKLSAGLFMKVFNCCRFNLRALCTSLDSYIIGHLFGLFGIIKMVNAFFAAGIPTIITTSCNTKCVDRFDLLAYRALFFLFALLFIQVSVSYLLNFTARLTFTPQSVALIWIRVKKLKCGRKQLLTLRTSLIPIRQCWSEFRNIQLTGSGIATFFTQMIQTIRVLLVPPERMKRFILFAFSTLLALRGIFGYDVIHDKANSLSSRLWMLVTSQGQNHIQSTPQLYHKSASQATLGGVLCL